MGTDTWGRRQCKGTYFKAEASNQGTFWFCVLLGGSIMVKHFWQWLKLAWVLRKANYSLFFDLAVIFSNPNYLKAAELARLKAVTDPAYNQANEWLWDAEIAEWTQHYLQDMGFDCSRSLAWLIAALQKAKEKGIFRSK